MTMTSRGYPSCILESNAKTAGARRVQGSGRFPGPSEIRILGSKPFLPLTTKPWRPYVEISGGGSWLVGGLGNAHAKMWAGQVAPPVGRTATRSAGHDPWRRPMERSREASREGAIQQLRSQRLKPELTFHLPGFYLDCSSSAKYQLVE
jgi:hypothetical protein